MNGLDNEGRPSADAAPGDVHDIDANIGQSIRRYVIGLILAAGLTAASFSIVHSPVIWAPGIPAALLVLAIAQIGVHLVFFLHITTGPEHKNNVLALAFGTLIVTLVVGGSLWIMANLDYHRPPLDEMVRMQR